MPLTAKTRVQYLHSSFEICVGMAMGQGFLRVFRFFSYQYHSTSAPYSFIQFTVAAQSKQLKASRNDEIKGRTHVASLVQWVSNVLLMGEEALDSRRRQNLVEKVKHVARMKYTKYNSCI
jgi:hypothetical protein